MINVKSLNNNLLKLEWYNEKGKYQSKIYPKEVIIPTIIKPEETNTQKMRDIYTQKEYYIQTLPYDYNNPKLTIPYKIRKNKYNDYYYNWILATKLLHFQKIIDKGISFPKHMYYDIETTSLNPSEGILTSVVFIDEKDKVYSFVNDNDDEHGMLMDIGDFLKKNKILSLIGFNSKKFDDEYLAYRMRVNNIRYNPIMSSNIDIMLMANKLFVSGSLASIAKQLGVIEKIELESNPIRLYENKEFNTLLEYNIRDVQVTKAICEKMGILPFVSALWDLSWCDFRNMNANSVLLDSYFNKKLWEDGLFVSKANLDYLGNFNGGLNYVL